MNSIDKIYFGNKKNDLNMKDKRRIKNVPLAKTNID